MVSVGSGISGVFRDLFWTVEILVFFPVFVFVFCKKKVTAHKLNSDVEKRHLVESLRNSYFSEILFIQAPTESPLGAQDYENLTEDITNQFVDVFATDFTDITGVKYTEHKIQLRENSAPISHRLPRYSPTQYQIMQDEVKKMLENGIVEHSNSPWCFPVILTPKPDGSTRFCVNYKKLNNITIKDKFPMPRIDDCLDFLSGKVFFPL